MLWFFDEKVKQCPGDPARAKDEPLAGPLRGGVLSLSPSVFKAERLGWTELPGDGADMAAS